MAENHHRWCIMASSSGQPLAWLGNPAGKQVPPRTAAGVRGIMGHYRKLFLARAEAPGG